MKIPLMDLQAQNNSIKAELDAAVSQVIQQASFIGGPEKAAFEKDFAKAMGAQHGVGVGNGTDAIFLVLKALGIGPGDEVVTAVNSFIASSEAITATGAKVVFCDVDEKNFLIDLTKLEDLLKTRSHKNGGRIKAILPVHLYGRIHDMRALTTLAEKYQVHMVEDTAQAHLAEWEGKKAGSFGIAGTFSFYPGKNLGAFGDAGAIITSNDDLALKVRKLADHGRISKYDHDMEGFNSRLDTLQAAVLRVKLRHLPQWTKARQERARAYDKLLASMPEVIRPEIPPGSQHVFHIYCLRVSHRDEVIKKLHQEGVMAGIHYPLSLHTLKAYAYLGHKPEDFPVAYKVQNELLSLPLYPELSEEQQVRVVETLKSALTQ